jgi:cytochrome c
MRSWQVMVGIGGLAALLGGAVAGAQTGDVAEGRTLYFDNCSGCHGLVVPESGRGSPGPSFPRLASVVLPAVTLTDATPVLGGHGARVAIAPPYGPTLRGIIGRPAGSIPGFLYSREFQKVMRGIVWTTGTLDAWITDTQAWVPGSFMFYKQPDPETRRKIIAYLEAVGTPR